jgi:hypothetical protein
MAHFAKLDSDNIVLAVYAVDNNDILDGDGNESEAVGIQFLQNVHGWNLWKMTSYNTLHGKYYTNNAIAADQTKAFRKNYACIGYRYDPTKDAFIPPKQHDSWVLNETKCIYEAPVTYPTITTYGDNGFYNIVWDEANQRWTATDEEDPEGSFIWNTSTLAWDNA